MYVRLSCSSSWSVPARPTGTLLSGHLCKVACRPTCENWSSGVSQSRTLNASFKKGLTSFARPDTIMIPRCVIAADRAEVSVPLWVRTRNRAGITAPAELPFQCLSGGAEKTDIVKGHERENKGFPEMDRWADRRTDGRITWTLPNVISLPSRNLSSDHREPSVGADWHLRALAVCTGWHCSVREMAAQ